MASVIVIQINGVDVTDDVIFSDAEFNSQASGSPGLCKFRLKDMNYVYSIVVGQTITLDVDGQRVWGGWVQVVTRQFFFPYTGSPLSQPRQVGPHGDPCLGVGSAVSSIASTPRALVIEGADYNILFRKRFAFDKANPASGVLKSWDAGTHDDVQIRWLCEHDLDLSGDGIDYVTKVEHVGAPEPDVKGNPVGAGMSWEDGMRAIARNTGAIFYIDPDKYLVYTDVDTPNAPYGLSDVTSAGVLGYREMEVLHNGSNLVNDAMVWGAGQGANRVKFKRTKDTESIAAHGLWQVGDFRGDLWRQASIDKRSDTFVYGSPQNKRGGKDDAVSVQVALFKPGFRVAQKVNFSSEVFGFSDVIPIRRMKVTFPTPTEARFDLVLSHYIDEPWNTLEYWFPKIYIPPPVIPKTKITNCPVENYPRGSDTNTPLGPGGFTAVFGDDFNRPSGTQPHSEMFGWWETGGVKWPPVIVDGGLALYNQSWAIKLATPISSDFQMILAVDLSGWNNLGYYSTYGYLRVTANGSPMLLDLKTSSVPTRVPTRLWAPVFIRVVSWTNEYLAYKIWLQNEPEPFYWTKTYDRADPAQYPPISVDIYTVHFTGNYAYGGTGSLPILKGVTLFANDEDSSKLAVFPADIGPATAYQPNGSSWGHTFKAPAYDESIIDFIYYPGPESSYRENTQFPSYQVHIQYSYFGGPTISWQQCYQHTASVFTTRGGYRYEAPIGGGPSVPVAEVYTAPEAIKITGKLKAEYSRSGGISAQPDPKEHQLEAYIEIFGFDEAQPPWLGEPYFRGDPFARKGYSFSNLFVWQGPQTRDFEIEMAYPSGYFGAENPGRLRWGVSIENPIDRIREIDGSHGPLMLANAADVVLSTTGVKYWARYPHVSGWTLMFCTPDSTQGGTTTQRTCEDVPLDLVMVTNNALANPWVYQLSSAYIPGSVTVTVDGAIARPNLDFMELDHAAGTVRFLNSFNQAERVTICYFPES